MDSSTTTFDWSSFALGTWIFIMSVPGKKQKIIIAYNKSGFLVNIFVACVIATQGLLSTNAAVIYRPSFTLLVCDTIQLATQLFYVAPASALQVCEEKVTCYCIVDYLASTNSKLYHKLARFHCSVDVV
jgi:hypothetical protein